MSHIKVVSNELHVPLIIETEESIHFSFILKRLFKYPFISTKQPAMYLKPFYILFLQTSKKTEVSILEH